ncbi:MAG: FAD-dependent oxidoreductase, partial [Fusobacterium sp.]
ITGAKVESLIVLEGKVIGVRAKKLDGTKLIVNSKAVILAMGGFSANNKLVSKYRPELKGYITTNAPSITGDVVDLGEKIGIAFIDMDQIQIHPTVRQEDGALITESLRGDGALLVNYKGEHFVDELETRDVVSKAEISQKGGFAWLIVDQKMYNNSNVIKKYYEKGYFIKGKNIKELSKNIGTNYKVLKKSLKLDNPPYYAVKVSPGIHHTMGGVKINEKAQVIDKNGNIIKGLYAAGEVTGGIHGTNRLGGNALSDLGTFGRIAGKNAVKEIKNTSL